MTSDPWDRSGDNHAVALIISNAYRSRHGMQPLDVHAVVDEDIADAILSSDWLARVKAEAKAEALEEAATYLRDYASEYEVAEKLITHANVYRSGVK